MKQIKNKLIIPGGIRYISDSDYTLNDFNFPHILDKKIPGCGYTEYCLTCNIPIVLCSPRIMLIENKVAQHGDDVFYFKNEYSTEIDTGKDLTKITKSSLDNKDVEFDKDKYREMLDNLYINLGNYITSLILLVISLSSAIELLKLYEITDKINKTIECANKKITLLKQRNSSCGNYKQTAALLAYSNIIDAKEINNTYLSKDYLNGISTFLGYYVLLVRAMANDIQGSLDLCRNYWGAMINLNATTFWEDFNIEWIKNAKPIDSLLKDDEYDVHGDNGAYCYKGFRHSLCHGWASGPVPFLSEYVLGIKVIQPGCKKIIIKPDLGDLKWAEGTFPTPYGKVYVKHEKENNEIKTIVKAPQEVKFEIIK